LQERAQRALETSESIELGQNFGNVELSPDRSQALGVVYDVTPRDISPRLAVVDLASGELRNFDTTMPPDQVTWAGAGGVILYTVRETLAISIPMTTEEQAALSRTFGTAAGSAGFPLYKTQIRRLDTATDADELVYAAPDDAASVARLSATDDHTLVLSEIPNLQAWIAAIAAGRFDPASATDFNTAQLATDPVKILSLDLTADNVTEVGADVSLLLLPPEMRQARN
jgi:hypothetical protein